MPANPHLDPLRTLDAPPPADTPSTVDATGAYRPTLSLPDAPGPATVDAVPAAAGDNGARESPPGFELLDEVGRGGMGVVYRARDRDLGREVAVKVLADRYATDSGTARRFVEEARITGQLQHPGIPAVYQVGALADGRPFLAMKLIKGQTLNALVRAEGPSGTRWLGTFEGICHAVGYAHARHVIHRDLKPHNVMVGAFGEVQVMDWGLAKVLANRADADGSSADSDAAGTEIRSARDSDTLVTLHGSVMGTPAYMSPEQAGGEIDKIGVRSDVFGLGAILCELFTGRPPFDGRNAESVRLNAVRGKTEEAFCRLDASGADPGVIALCKRCLAFEPADRPATANELAAAVADLRRAADDRAGEAERAKLAAEVREGEQRRRRRTVQWAAGAVAAVLLAGVVGTAVGLVEARRQRADADEAWEKEATARGVAERKTTDAEAARRDAERAADDAQAVRSLMEDILKQGSGDGRAAAGTGGPGELTVKRAMDYTARTVGERFKDRPRVEGEVRDTLGTTYFRLGAYPEAAEQLEKAVDVRRRELGPKAEETLKSLNNLAVTYRAVARYPDAERIFLEVLAAKRETLGEKDRSTLTTINNLGNYYLTRKDFARAEEFFRTALDGRREVLGEEDEHTQISYSNVAAVLFQTKRYADALPLYQRAADGFTKVHTRDAPTTTLRVVRNQGICHARLGQREEAETLLLEVIDRSEKLQPGEKKVLLPDAAAELVRLYEDWGRPAAAAVWRVQLKEHLPVVREPAPPPRPAR